MKKPVEAKFAEFLYRDIMRRTRAAWIDAN